MEGIYYRYSKESVTFLKFYEDGLVLEATMSDEIPFDGSFFEQFDRQSPMNHLWYRGRLKSTDNGKIEFRITYPDEKIEYSGYFYEIEKILFSVKSSNSNNIDANWQEFNKVDSSLTDEFGRNHRPEYYPIILIPAKIKKSVNKEVSTQRIYELMGVEFPYLEKIKEPQEPDVFYRIEKNNPKIHFNLVGILAIAPISLVLIASAIIGFNEERFLVSFILLALGVFLLTFIGRIEHRKFVEKIKKPNDVFKEEMDAYERKVYQIRKKNKELESKYEKAVEEIELSIHKEDKQKALLSIFYKSLKPSLPPIRRDSSSVLRGFSEEKFYHQLKKTFPDEVFVDKGPQNTVYKYFPDITFVCKKTGICLDIEIDEPYTFDTREPIHYIGSRDDERNKEILRQNWCIIRFSEEQIITEPQNCIKLVKGVLDTVRQKSINYAIPVKEKPRWSLEEAKKMADQNYRENYMKFF